MGQYYNQLISPGALPPRPQELSFGWGYEQPLQPGAVPPSVTQLLTFASALPSAMCWSSIIDVKKVSSKTAATTTCPRTSHRTALPLQLGSMSHGVVYLNLGHEFNQPLSPGVLPSSLRELIISGSFRQRLQRGSLLDGLEVLACQCDSRFDQLQPGVIPASLKLMLISATCCPLPPVLCLMRVRKQKEDYERAKISSWL